MDREWLLCNGRGGFASGTAVGVPTRRYHGLLCVAARPPLERWMLLSAVLEKLTAGGESVELAAFEFDDAVHPRGYEYLTGYAYDLDPERSWFRQQYRWHRVSVTRTVRMRRGRDDVEIRYDVEAPADVDVEFGVMPLAAMRDFHSLPRGRRPMRVDTREAGFLLRGPSEACPPMTMSGACTAASGEGVPVRFEQHDDWWTGFHYRAEAERGQDSHEDLFVPGWFHVRARGRFVVTLRAAAGTTTPDAGEESSASSSAASTPAERLHQAARQFVVQRDLASGRRSTTILAGYPWFGDWGRDTFIALPGLLLADKAFEEARDVLCTFAGVQKEGLIPNRFSDYGGGCDYNSVDASLWYVRAANAYLIASGDHATWNDILAPACERVVDAFAAGTRYHIRMDDDGLITAGDASTQLTWMDAKCGDVVFTPRHGKAVEINALWHHALCVLADRSSRGERFAAMARRVRESFGLAFWNPQRKCLYDCVRPGESDGAIRPNQIFAVSLAPALLDAAQQQAVLACVREHLLTPYGLRSLSPSEPAYRGRYAGGPYERDGAYHQGTVWGWLIGPYVEALLRVHDFSADARREARQLLEPLIRHLDEAGLGSVSEVFDGDPPHKPGGCTAQAWSVAELRRALALIES